MSQILGAGRTAPAGLKYNIIDLTAATRTLTEDESGSLVLFNAATGIDVTLPLITADNIGMWFLFQVDTPVSAESYTITASTATQLYSGAILNFDTDTSYAPIRYAADESNDIIFTMNATTMGGGIGDDWILFIAESTTRWRVTGLVWASGSVATPFS